MKIINCDYLTESYSQTVRSFEDIVKDSLNIYILSDGIRGKIWVDKMWKADGHWIFVNHSWSMGTHNGPGDKIMELPEYFDRVADTLCDRLMSDTIFCNNKYETDWRINKAELRYLCDLGLTKYMKKRLKYFDPNKPDFGRADTLENEPYYRTFYKNK